ncbi:MAG: PKD domain-containing protein [bacterium]|nr:PKD domain-containing protein [bacterium]
MQRILNLHRLTTLLFLTGMFFSYQSVAQYCDPTVPTFNVDLSASPNVNWTSPLVARNGNCCGTTNPDNCLEFVITLHPNAIAVNFQITGGAVPPGALFYQIDCGPVTPVGQPICLDGPGPHTLTFCKPGNNTNAFTITSYSEPIIGPDITLNAACQGFIYGNYYDETTISWTSIAPGATGDYDNLLSCTLGCDTTYVTAPNSGAPAFVDYQVCGMDVGGCNPNPICDTIRVTFVPPVTVTISDGGPICFGETTTLTANVSGGTGPYNILWSTGETTNSITAGAGAYTVDVTDASGCLVATDNFNVTAFPLPNVDAGPDQVICEGPQVTLSATGAVTYVWDNGITDGVAFTPSLGTTTYTVTGTDANGCQNTDQVDVTVNPLPVVNAGADQVVCEGTAVTLSGSGAATYVWDNGVTDGAAFTPGVGTITYTVTGTDANGCVDTDQVDVTVNPLPVVSAGPDQTVCEGTQVTLNGSGAVTYAWDNGITDGTAFTPTIGTTTFTVTGTDANGCQNTDQVDVTVNPLPIVDAGPDQTVCDGAQVTLTASGASTYVWDNGITNGVAFTPSVGSTTFTVTGTDANGCVNTDQVVVLVNPLPNVSAGNDVTVCEGAQVTLNATGATTYVWDNGVPNGGNFVPPLGTSTYTVTGTDANGCVNTDQVDITVNPLPIVDAGPDQIVCAGTAVTLSGSGASTYNWSNGVIDGVPFTPAIGSIDYTVTGTDANGCSNSDMVNVTVNPLPNVNAGPDQTVCEGAQVTLNGSGAQSYVWDNGITDGVAFTPAVGSTTFTVTGTDDNGCVNTDQVVVLVNPLPNVSAGNDITVCEGAQVTLNGSGASTYVWDNGVTNGTPFVPPVGTTTYTVTGTDANGCVNTDQVDVNVNPLPTVDAGPDQTVCTGTSVTLSGSGASTYNWSNGVIDGVAFTPAIGAIDYTVTGTDANGCSSTDIVNVTVNPLPNVNAGPDQTVCDGAQVTLSGSGAQTYVWDNGITDGVAFTPAVGTTTYTVTGTDANGCVNTDQVDVTVNPLPTVEAGPNQTVCEGVQVTLSGSGAQTYAWDNGITNGVAFTPAVGTTTYTVTGTDGNGCVNNDQVDVTVNPLPIVDAGPNQTVCDGEQVTLNGSGASSYAWDNGITDGAAFTPSLGTTTYTVTGTDANGCVNTDQVDVNVNPLPVVSAGPNQEVCEGEQVTLNGSGALTYVWDNGVINGVAFTPSVGTTTYTVTGTDANACSNNDQVDVLVNPLPIVAAGEDFYSCDGEEITLNAVGSPNLVWGGGIIDGVPFVPTGTQAYVVYDTLATGCTANDTIVVYINPNPVVTAPDAEICPGDGVTLNGAGALTYVWDNGVTDGVEFYPTSTTEYIVEGTDGNGCSDVDTSLVRVMESPNASFQILDMSLTTLDPTTGFANQSVGAVSYEWNFGDGSNISTEFEPTHTFPTDEPGEYEIVLTAYSAEGCPDQAVKYIHVFSDYTVYVPNAFTPDGNGANEIFKPVMDGFDPNDYELLIFNRWGDIIFESHNLEVGWDGTFARQDYEVQDGVYTWKITAGLENGNDTKIFVGHVTLLK